MHDASREKAFETLGAFVPKAGTEYAETRNFDFGPGHRTNTSTLSPYLQRRLISEEEVLVAVLREHSRASCSKFAQEVLWRSYWKSWLELRPTTWNSYRASLQELEEHFGSITAPRDERFALALAGRSGLEPFDAWRRELSDSGFLHNHTRMWFASIWIFTLQLPWQLGAALFLSELLDADAASNTLSWRWVAGLHTKGKGYVATAANIARFTSGRFSPVGELNETPTIAAETEHFPLGSVPDGFERSEPPTGRVGLLVTPEDLSVDATILSAHSFATVACFAPPSALDARHASAAVRAFEEQAVIGSESRFRERWRCAEVFRCTDAHQVRQWCKNHDLEAIVTILPWTGFLRPLWETAVDGCEVPTWEGIRHYDLAVLPLATRGFFPFLAHLPDVLDRVEVAAGPSAVRFRLRERRHLS